MRTIVARVGVQLLGELLFGSDGWDRNRRYSGKIQQVPKCDFLYRARIMIDNIDVEAKRLS